MPITDSRRRVSVLPFTGAGIQYGFLTNIDTAQSQQLGQNELAQNATPVGTVFGANSPKPARATRRFASGTVTSFISATVIPQARQQGWKVGRGRIRRGGSTAFSISVYVTIQGFKYAWQIPRRLYDAFQADLTTMGITVAQPGDTDLVWGADSPKPPRTRRTVLTGDELDTFTTFKDPSSPFADGWSGVTERVDAAQGPS